MSIEMLRSHWGFGRNPFTKDLAASMLHGSVSHQEAIARMSWCINEGAIGVFTGEVGAGKTVAIRAATATLDSSRFSVIYLPNPTVGVRGVYATIVSALGQTPRFYRVSLCPQAHDALSAERNERGRQVVFIVDEAHLLDSECLEELRMLTCSDMDSSSPMSLLLIGQPTLRRRIKHGQLAALDQRISIRYVLSGMGRDETASYISHHLKLAGRSDTLFSDDAIDLIHQVSRGLPRMVNNLCVQSLIAAYATNKTIVDESTARIAVSEVTAD
jgi:type II secretory pathway predicted ATPase ExeA